MSRVEVIGGAELWLGDAREIVPTLAPVDSLITDPPYGIDFGGKSTKHTTRRHDGYIGGDTAEGPAVVALALAIAVRGAVFPGIRQMFRYPEPDDIGGIFCPAGAGVGRWGWVGYHPVLFYGTRPGSGLYPTCITSFATAEPSEHPCPKPEKWMRWLISLASLPGETVLDPFMGAGTTLVECIRAGRCGVGIEIEPKYYEIALRRIEAASRQADLFHAPAPAPRAAPADLFAVEAIATQGD